MILTYFGSFRQMQRSLLRIEYYVLRTMSKSMKM